MKKILSILAVLLCLGTTSVFAKGNTGVGAQFGYNIGGGAGGALTLKLQQLPCYLAVNAGIGSGFNLGATADWWLANPKIQGTWGYFYGVGGACNFASGEEWAAIGVGARALIGTNVFIFDNFLEFYGQVAWQPEFWINTAGKGNAGFNWTNIPLNLGFRFWF